MAEIIDVITRLAYETDTKGVDQSIKAIETEINSIDQQYRSIERLQVLRAKTSKENVDQINRINAAIENRKKVIAQETKLIENNVRSNGDLRKALAAQGVTMLQATDRLDKLTASSNKSNYAMLNLARVVQDAPYGFIGIANNIDPLLLSFQQLQAESGGVKGAFKALGSSLIGGAGIGLAVSIVTSLLVTFGDKLFSAGDEAEGAAKKLSAFDKAINDTAKSIADELVDLRKLSDTITNANLSYKERGEAVDELQSKYPEYFSNLDREKILNGEVKDAYDAVAKSIVERAKQTANYNLILTKQQELQQAQLELDQLTNNKNANVFFYTNQDRVNQLKAIVSNKQREIDAITDGMKAQQAAGVSNAYWLSQEQKAQYLANQEKEKSLALMTKEEREKYLSDLKKKPKEVRAKELRANMGLPDSAEFDQIVSDAHELEILQKAVADIYKRGQQAFAESLIGGGAETPESRRLNAQLQIAHDVNAKREKDEKEAQKKSIERAKEQKDLYKQIAESAIQAFQSIYDAQLKLLDSEISVRRDRVEQAVKLAERGNAEILKSEQERLDKASEKRDDVARRQLQINALLQASSAGIAAAQALQTVTNAGATGDPYTTALRIAAAVAALIAGFASVKGALTASFAEGVIGLNGPGTETSDSIPARLSRGESVMTAKETTKFRDALLAMRAGDFDKKFIPINQLVNPVIIQQTQSSQDYKSLEKRLDTLIELQQNNGISVHTGITNGHIATIVESQRKFEQRRRS